MNAPARTEDKFHRLIHENHMYGLWEVASQMTPQPRPEAIAYQWKWPLLEGVVKESAVAVAVRVLLPGEVARAHRHSPAAIRFIMQGNGAYTAVEGEKVVMREGDLVLTPSWQWHDHGNETKETVVWMDGLDVPLTKALNSIFFEMGGETRQAASKPVNGSRGVSGQ